MTSQILSFHNNFLFFFIQCDAVRAPHPDVRCLAAASSHLPCHGTRLQAGALGLASSCWPSSGIYVPSVWYWALSSPSSGIFVCWASYHRFHQTSVYHGTRKFIIASIRHLRPISMVLSASIATIRHLCLLGKLASLSSDICVPWNQAISHQASLSAGQARIASIRHLCTIEAGNFSLTPSGIFVCQTTLNHVHEAFSSHQCDIRRRWFLIAIARQQTLFDNLNSAHCDLNSPSPSLMCACDKTLERV